MKTGTCKNCGADESIHQYETMRCPWGGYETPIGQKERWSNQTFEEDKQNDKAAETQAIFAEYERINLAQAEQIAALKELHKAVAIVIAEHKAVTGKYYWRDCDCSVCRIFTPLLMGDPSPVETK